jgi:hypothetical protein
MILADLHRRWSAAGSRACTFQVRPDRGGLVLPPFRRRSQTPRSTCARAASTSRPTGLGSLNARRIALDRERARIPMDTSGSSARRQTLGPWLNVT